MYRGEHVDILYGNVKHAFFQVIMAHFAFHIIIVINLSEKGKMPIRIFFARAVFNYRKTKQSQRLPVLLKYSYKPISSRTKTCNQ